jgi:hypothetical protein
LKIAASIFDHPGILLIIAAITLVRWLIQKGKDAGQNTQSPSPPPPTPNRPIQRGSETQTEEERVRKFLEALGQPAGTTPPKVMPRRRPVQPQIFPKLPRLKTAPPPLPPAPETQVTAPPPLPIELPGQWSAALQSPDFFQVHDVPRQTSSEPAPETRRAATVARFKLGTRQDLRTAIVLREIFGPPRSLQTFDSVSGL